MSKNGFTFNITQLDHGATKYLLFQQSDMRETPWIPCLSSVKKNNSKYRQIPVFLLCYHWKTPWIPWESKGDHKKIKLLRNLQQKRSNSLKTSLQATFSANPLIVPIFTGFFVVWPFFDGVVTSTFYKKINCSFFFDSLKTMVKAMFSSKNFFLTKHCTNHWRDNTFDGQKKTDRSIVGLQATFSSNVKECHRLVTIPKTTQRWPVDSTKHAHKGR